MISTLTEIRTFIQTLDAEKQMDGLIVEYLIKFCDMRKHEPGTYYDFSAKYGIQKAYVFKYVTTECRTSLIEFRKNVSDLINKKIIKQHKVGGIEYLHLNIDLDDPFDFQIKAGLNRTILNKIYPGVSA